MMRMLHLASDTNGAFQISDRPLDQMPVREVTLWEQARQEYTKAKEADFNEKKEEAEREAKLKRGRR